MVIIISGASHVGKTYIAQKLLEKNNYPYLSIDHLKMGLIRSDNTNLTPLDDDKLTNYLWPIVTEMIKTVIENKQNLIVEGCYVPFDWYKSFNKDYLENINCYFVVMSRKYIQNNYNNIINYANIIENRLDDNITKEQIIIDNEIILKECEKNNLQYILIDEEYDINQIMKVIYEKK